MLPSRRALAAEFGVAVNTLQKAVGSLTRDGLIESQEGGGSFVSRLTQPTVGAINRVADGEQAIIQHVAVIGLDDHSRSMGGTPTGEDVESERWERSVLGAMEQELSAQQVYTDFHPVGMPHTPGYRDNLLETIRQFQIAPFDAIAVINLKNIPEWEQELSVASDSGSCPLMYVAMSDVYLHVPSVSWDQVNAGYEAARHLHSRGFRRLLFVEPFAVDWLEQRIMGATKALAGRQMGASSLAPVRPKNKISWTQYTSLTSREMERVTADLASQLAPAIAAGQAAGQPVGVISPNDQSAEFLVGALATGGFRSGVDYGVIGFDNSPAARRLGLSTIAPPLASVGRTAAQILMRLLAAESVPVQSRMSGHVVARGSTVSPATERS